MGHDDDAKIREADDTEEIIKHVTDNQHFIFYCQR